jgi:prephenate dehydrogenase
MIGWWPASATCPSWWPARSPPLSPRSARTTRLVWELAAGGFRDTSRVAASDTQMFLDILLTNRAAVLEQIDNFDRHLQAVRDLLEGADEAGLRVKLGESQKARAGWRKR